MALAACAIGAAPAHAGEPGARRCTTPQKPERGHRMLFDGTRASLRGWSQAGEGRFRLTRACHLESAGGLGLLWHEDEVPKPFTVKLAWRSRGNGNSGVFVGFPPPGDDALVAVRRGYEVQIDPTDEPDATTGAIYREQAPDIARRDAALNPPGRWNAFAITVGEDRIAVRLNGVLVNRFLATEAASRLAHGHVGIQNHGPADRVQFRDIRVKPR